MTAARRLTRAGAALAMLVVSTLFSAHPLAPALLAVDLTADRRAQVEWRVPLAVAARAQTRPRLPASCKPLERLEVTTDDASHITRWQARCRTLAPGDTFEVHGLELLDTDVLVRVRLADGGLARGVLSARQPVFAMPARDAWAVVFRDYFRLGVAHLLGGFDHLAFIFGLMLLALRAGTKSRARRLAWAVTAFTLGHSVSLSLVTLGLVTVPSGPVEAAIALSIVWLAVELAAGAGSDERQLARQPWWMAGGFGGLHGFGFAGALTEVGLPAGEIPAALLAFNLGLEAGQLAVVLIAFVPLDRLARARRLTGGVLPRGAGYVGGVLAAYWAVERSTALF